MGRLRACALQCEGIHLPELTLLHRKLLPETYHMFPTLIHGFGDNSTLLSFIHVLSPVVPTFALPRMLSERFSFDKANPEQIALIKKSLPMPGHQSLNIYEAAITSQGKCSHSFSTQRDQSLWRYFVINVEHDHDEDQSLNMAFQLTEYPLELGYSFAATGCSSSTMGHLAAVFSFLESVSVDPMPTTLSDAVLDAAMSNFQKIRGNCSPRIRRAMNRFDALRGLPRQDDMLVLGLFAVLEGLITHEPRSPSHGDSLTHQVSTKMALLSKRFKIVNKSEDDKKLLSDKKAWCALYDWRSEIAHGGEPDFATNPLKIFATRANALAFLQSNLRRLLLFALDEPELIEDLNAC